MVASLQVQTETGGQMCKSKRASVAHTHTYLRRRVQTSKDSMTQIVSSDVKQKDIDVGYQSRQNTKTADCVCPSLHFRARVGVIQSVGSTSVSGRVLTFFCIVNNIPIRVQKGKHGGEADSSFSPLSQSTAIFYASNRLKYNFWLGVSQTKKKKCCSCNDQQSTLTASSQQLGPKQ